MKRTIEIIVSGRVQGVFYRQSTLSQAKQLQVTGFVENLANGEVRIIATGEESSLKLLYEWCRLGPPKAEVSKITQATIPLREFKTFEIKR